MIIWIIALVILLLALSFFLMARKVSSMDGSAEREVLHLYENVEWNSQAAEFVQRKMRELKWSILVWMGVLLLVQTVVIFLAIIYVLENAG